VTQGAFRWRAARPLRGVVVKLVEGLVAKLHVPRGKRDIQVFDDALPGFGVRVFASGKASYFVKFNVGKQQRKKSLGPVLPGNLATKRKAADDILTRARIGQDVVAETRAAAKAQAARRSANFGKLVTAYLADCRAVLRPASHAASARYLERYWARLHPLSLDAVSRSDVVSVIDHVAVAHGKVAADRARAALSVFFAWAIDRGHVNLSPVQNIASRSQSEGRERVLSEPELVAVWRACLDDDYGRIIRLLILTAQRKTEIGSLDRAEINGAERQIELPPERTKNKRPHVVPLSPQAWAILAIVPQIGKRTKFFGLRMGGFSGWSKAKAQLDKRLPKEMAPWTVHDIRRSVVTHLHERGFASPHIVEAIVNHVSGHRAGVAGRYNKALYLPERRKALGRWGQHVLRLVKKAEAGGTP